MSGSTQHPAIELIVAWWRDQLLMTEKRDAFAAALRNAFDAAWASEVRESGELAALRLEVDYDPNAVLLDALRDCGIECRGFMFSAEGIFRQKTRMRVEVDEITVREGYGAPFVEIWSAP